MLLSFKLYTIIWTILTQKNFFSMRSNYLIVLLLSNAFWTKRIMCSMNLHNNNNTMPFFQKQGECEIAMDHAVNSAISTIFGLF